MQKAIRLFAFLFFGSSLLSAQSTTEIDQLKYQATYLLTYQSDSTDVHSIEVEEMVLSIGSKTSKFTSLGTYLKDSINQHITQIDKNSLNLMLKFGNIPKTQFKEKIFKNLPSDQMTVTEQILKDYFQYQEPKDLFNWTITNESDQIAGYNCQKAETTFAGRQYTAWFTNAIPISDGPYKFNGLPGLIIKITDAKNQYTYELLSFQKANEDRAITMNKKNYIDIEKEQFFTLKREFYKNIFKKLEQSGLSINLDSSTEKKEILDRYEKRNNPIEIK